MIDMIKAQESLPADQSELPTIERIEEIPSAIAGQHVVIVGNVGSGKTWTAKAFVELILQQRRRCVIWDPTGVWWGLRYSKNGGPGFNIGLIGGEFGDVPINPDAGGHIAKIIAHSDIPLILDISEMTMGERHHFATECFTALYHENRRPLHLIVDEADEVAPQNPLPETRRMLGAFDRIIRRGRVRGFRSMMITQRPAVLHKNVLSQATTLIAMRLIGAQDRDAVEAWIKGQADMGQGKKMLASLPGLQTGEGYIWSPSLSQPLQKIRFPTIATMDSSRTPTDEEPALRPPAVPMRGEILDYEVSFLSERSDSDEAEKPPAKGKGTMPSTKSTREVDDLQRAIDRQTEEYQRGIREGILRADNTQREILNRLLVLCNEMTEVITGFTSTSLVASGLERAPEQREQPQREPPPPASAESVRKKAAGNRAAAGLEGAGGKLLTAFAQLAAGNMMPLTWDSIAIAAVLVPGNGYFYSGKRYLIDQGFVEAGDAPFITEAGLKAIGGARERPTRKFLVEQWCNRLRQPGGKLLSVLASTPRDSYQVAGLARIIETKPGNGYWYAGMKALRNANLIQEKDGQISLCTFLSKLR